MSDNISQLHPQKHPGLGKRIAVFAVLLVFVTGGVAAYVFRDRLNLDALQRYVPLCRAVRRAVRRLRDGPESLR